MDRLLPERVQVQKDTLKALLDFAGPKDNILRFYTDNSGELEAAAAELSWRHDTSTPNRPQTNGMAESAVRKVIEGTRAVLLQSGLPHRWWAEASRCYGFLRNVFDDVKDGKSPYQLRDDSDFCGQRLPFGCAVQYKPSADREVDNMKSSSHEHVLAC